MNRFFRHFFSGLICVLIISCCTGCIRNPGNEKMSIPEIPSRLSRTDDDTPVLKVYNTEKESTDEMDIETYLMGVVAGEMRNDWPIEALKAQAILARTFTMRFLSDKTSSYDGADISTDVSEAQAYNSEAVNDRVREAVNETRGMVMTADGEFPYAWFHAHSGGITELPSKALEYKIDPSYLSVARSEEHEKAPAEVKSWTAEFTQDEVEKACKEVGIDPGEIKSFKIGEKGESGRAVTFLVNEKEVSAPAFRLRIDATKLKSTLIDSIEFQENKLIFTGRGFGHGVGMSQWGAYKMAEDGKTAEEIIHHYYTGVDLVELW